ncbi:MAG: amylo-alpha-1,6-glucosidase, partial [Acetivibrio ethanolgignens]
EEGFRYISYVSYERVPSWNYHIEGVSVKKILAIGREKNTVAVLYTLENRSPDIAVFCVEPFLKFAPKEEALQEEKEISYRKGRVTDGKYSMFVRTNGRIEEKETFWQLLSYPEDEKDGRPGKGLCACCFSILKEVKPQEIVSLEIVFSVEELPLSGEEILKETVRYQESLEEALKFSDPVARELAIRGDDFIVRRDSTKGKTILAGYPLFSDWGRDTMIALPGLTLSTGRFEEAKSILKTFLTYERDGLIPNLFPEGGEEPLYNTADAALLLLDCIWQYYIKTGDKAFVKDAWRKMEHIIACYRQGTHHGIRMDEDGLIFAGEGLDQVTWMDVCVEGILPTPRHGKPVEINAYWYNALRIMDTLAAEFGFEKKDYLELSEKVRHSFREKFFIQERGYLRDVLCGGRAEEQLRCNQLWAVAQSFTMLTPEQEKSVIDTVYQRLYTSCGIRTLAIEDPEFREAYSGVQKERDMAYHQGTVWIYPMGAYYLSYLKVHGYSKEAARYVKEQLNALVPMLIQGCVGQLPEIYDGKFPVDGKGCFAQAWSVGEMLRVYEKLEEIQKDSLEISSSL